jgi:hypothetical protein
MWKTAKYVFESEFLEEQVRMDVSNYLGSIGRQIGFGVRIRLLTSNESVTGADAQLPWRGTTYFLQFKKPTGLRSTKDVPLPKKPRKGGEAATQRIRRYREANDLADTPYALCFPLRKKAKTATELQHNLLFSYERPPHSRAIYVCPTVTTSKEYDESLSVAWPHWWFEEPFSVRDYALVVEHVAHWVERAPFLRGHAAIVPHAKVKTHEHSYSFSRHGSDVAFHSPEVVRRSVKRLSEFVAGEIRAISAQPDGLPTMKSLTGALAEVAETWAGDELLRINGETDAAWLARHGKVLEERYGIRQFLLLTRPSDAKKAGG